MRTAKMQGSAKGTRNAKVTCCYGHPLQDGVNSEQDQCEFAAGGFGALDKGIYQAFCTGKAMRGKKAEGVEQAMAHGFREMSQKNEHNQADDGGDGDKSPAD